MLLRTSCPRPILASLELGDRTSPACSAAAAAVDARPSDPCQVAGCPALPQPLQGDPDTPMCHLALHARHLTQLPDLHRCPGTFCCVGLSCLLFINWQDIVRTRLEVGPGLPYNISKVGDKAPSIVPSTSMKPGDHPVPQPTSPMPRFACFMLNPGPTRNMPKTCRLDCGTLWYWRLTFEHTI